MGKHTKLQVKKKNNPMGNQRKAKLKTSRDKRNKKRARVRDLKEGSEICEKRYDKIKKGVIKSNHSLTLTAKGKLCGCGGVLA